MLICSSGEGVFITLQFSFSFCYYSHTGNCQLENNASKRSRFDYDKHRDMTIKNYAEQKDSCLQVLDIGTVAFLELGVYRIFNHLTFRTYGFSFNSPLSLDRTPTSFKETFVYILMSA